MKRGGANKTASVLAPASRFLDCRLSPGFYGKSDRLVKSIRDTRDRELQKSRQLVGGCNKAHSVVAHLQRRLFAPWN